MKQFQIHQGGASASKNGRFWDITLPSQLILFYFFFEHFTGLMRHFPR